MVASNSTASSRDRSGGAPDDAASEVDEGSRAVGSGQHVLGPHAAVRDAHRVQPPEVRPRVVEDRVGDALGLHLRQRDTFGFAQHQQGGVVGTADTGDHDLAHRYSRALREQEQVRAVLQLLRARQRQGEPRVLVPERAPHLREQPGVHRVAPDDLDGDRSAVGCARDEARLTPQLLVGEREIGDRHAEPDQPLSHLVEGRRRGRGPDDEVERGRDTPREREARHDVFGHADERDERADGPDRQQRHDQPARGAE